MDLKTEIGTLMTEYAQDNLEHIHKDTFTANMRQYITELLKAQLENEPEDTISSAYQSALSSFHGRTTTVYPSISHDILSAKLTHIQHQYQPEQRSPEWFSFRNKLLTASSISKVLGSVAKRNELICSKCNPVTVTSYTHTSGPMHWGIKYEPISIEYYCYKNKTQVQSYGCIAHSTYPFIGASPDGINVLETSPLYGVMLEIKNPISRQINGNPKEEYWVQCQIQMEVCDLDACDFLETKFTEYASEEEFNADGSFQLTHDNKYKGIILHFEIDGMYHYEYLPFQSTAEEYTVWKTSKLEQYPAFIKEIYWKLECVECTIIPRNRAWFQWFLPQIIELQSIIDREKNTDEWKQRLPKKKNKLLMTPFSN
jgi:putative phage-type endonuclease